VPVDLHRTLTGDGPLFHVAVSEDARQAGADLVRAELQIEVAHLTTRDEVQVVLDGTELAAPRVRDAAGEDPEDPSDVSESCWLTWPLGVSQAGRGVHEIRIRLVERDARLRVPLRIEHVEVYLKYRASREEQT
jgi:hypothetical protein